MPTAPIRTSGHTDSDGALNLEVQTGVPDSDVVLEIRVIPVAKPRPSEAVDANGWPLGFLERFAGSMPQLERAPQGEFESRLPL